MRLLVVQAVSVSRIAACFVFVAISLQPALASWALGLAIAAALSDLVDGWLARSWQVASNGGSMLDACADKAMSSASSLYAVAVGMPLIPCLMVLVRDIVVLSFRQVRVDDRPLIEPKRWLVLRPSPLFAWLLSHSFVAALLACHSRQFSPGPSG
ncbi:MAG: hypothetical protein HC888_08150 [Candidatus Competibacteraceae bacterium]|nr:hypothetical protein [Candidatus Competibacteraceae bacterium]